MEDPKVELGQNVAKGSFPQGGEYNLLSECFKLVHNMVVWFMFMHLCLWLGVKEDLIRTLLSHFKSASVLKKSGTSNYNACILVSKEQPRFAFIIDKDLPFAHLCSSFLQVTKRHGTTS